MTRIDANENDGRGICGGLLYPEESYKIIGACFNVYNEMGCGFLENVYQECLGIEFSRQGILFVAQKDLRIRYRNVELKRRYIVDYICYEKIIVELKAVSTLLKEHSAQVLNYLHATDLSLALLANFGHYPKLEYKRIALSYKSRKKDSR